MAVLTVQFEVGVPRTDALVRLYDTINSNRDWVSPDLGIGEPIIKPKGIDDVPIVALTLWTEDDSRGAYELERVAHAVEAELKRVPGTREVQTLGGPGRSVRVLLDADRLAAHGVSALELRGALQLSNVALPTGRLVRENREVVIETGNYLESATDVARLVIGTFEGRPVYLSEVAQVLDGPNQPARYAWTGSAKGEHPAVTLQVSKKPGENAVSVARRVLERAEELRGTVIPDDVHVTVTRNYGATANDKAMRLIQKLLFATLSVVALVLAALGRREALIVGAAVLLTLASTLFASWAWGFTLNRVSLFALIFSIGILVDDAIVVVENIHRRMALERKPLAEVIPLAVDEVGGPTILATFTVIAALLPMAFVSGLMGPYMRPIPTGASAAMLFSLAVAFIVSPWAASRIFAHGHATDAAAGRPEGWSTRVYRRSMTALVTRPALRWIFFAGVVLVLLGAAAMVGLGLVKVKMLPFDNKSEFQVMLDHDAGTPLDVTLETARQMSAHLSSLPEVEDVEIYAGTAAPYNFNGLVRHYFLRRSPPGADLQVNLVGKHEREAQSHDIAKRVRPALVEIAERRSARVKVVEIPPGPPVLETLVAEVYGPWPPSGSRWRGRSAFLRGHRVS
jgi:multidrug efflux pump subunit AcrB